jgi:dienelactone hydrolase
VPRPALAALALALLAGCGGSRPPADGIPRLDLSYAGELGYRDRGAVNHGYPIAIHDVSFRSGGRRVDGFLLLPPGTKRRPAVLFVHGSGADRSELLTPAAWLAARGVVALTITAPSSAHPPAQAVGPAVLEQQRDLVVDDVVAARRAVDVLRALPTVDGDRIGYLGWSAGAKLGTYLAASDDRVDALALLSAGADPLSAFVQHAPASLEQRVRRVLGSVDPLRYVAWAKGDLLLEDGRSDEVIPRAALENVIHAAPKGTTVRWYDAGHALTPKAYLDAFDWLGDELDVHGPAVPGARTGP